MFYIEKLMSEQGTTVFFLLSVWRVAYKNGEEYDGKCLVENIYY